MFRVGEAYTRQEIHEFLGGGLQDYLPSVRGRIVCGCFSPRLDPQAPDVILPGDGPDIQKKAEWLCQQGGPVPVFIKRATNCWEYAGRYAVSDWSDRPEDLAREQSRTGRRDITRVIWLARRDG